MKAWLVGKAARDHLGARFRRTCNESIATVAVEVGLYGAARNGVRTALGVEWAFDLQVLENALDDAVSRPDGFLSNCLSARRAAIGGHVLVAQSFDQAILTEDVLAAQAHRGDEGAATDRADEVIIDVRDILEATNVPLEARCFSRRGGKAERRVNYRFLRCTPAAAGTEHFLQT